VKKITSNALHLCFYAVPDTNRFALFLELL
jgi:hypothetical protein